MKFFPENGITSDQDAPRPQLRRQQAQLQQQLQQERQLQQHEFQQQNQFEGTGETGRPVL